MGLLTIGILSLCLGAPQEPPRNLTFEAKLRRVAVFRDGYGFYVREGRVKLENGWVTTNFVPNAIRGTVWVYPLDSQDRIDTVIVTRDNKIALGSPAEMKQRLSDKVGLNISVVLKNNQRFEGVLSRLLDDMLLLQVGAAFTAIPYDQIASISLVGFPIRVKFDTKDPNKVTGVGIAYLQEGIRWEPSYVLTIQKGKAVLNLRATMQNTTERLENTDVLFVVGSPFVVNRGLQDMIALLPPDAQKGILEDRAPMAEEGAGAGAGRLQETKLAAPLSGEEAGELYYYLKPGFSLATNDIAMVSIFSERVEIAPRFEWNADGEDVFYLLDIKNPTQQPLTTGSVFVIENEKPLGQETIKYTPPGATAEVRLSRGIGIRVKRQEAEIKRGAAVKVGDSMFIPVTIKGTLNIYNFREDKAIVKITKTARGKVLELSDNGIVRETQVLRGEVNPINDLEWTIQIPAKGMKEITYSIETLIYAERGAPPVPAGAGG